MRIHLFLAGALQALGLWSATTLSGPGLWDQAGNARTTDDFQEFRSIGLNDDVDQLGEPVIDNQSVDNKGFDVDGAQDSAVALAAIAQPNLRVVGITHQAYVYPDNTCSAIFYVRIQNAGTATAWSLSVGAKGWGTPSISTCTGLWRAFNTTANLAPGQYRTVGVYGPGYVGPRVLKGTPLTITGYADVHCSVAESSESDNSRNTVIQVGL